MTHRSLAALLVAVAFAAACGGATPPAEQPAPATTASAAPAPTETATATATASAAPPVASTPPAEAPAPAPPGPGEWDKWSHEQKLAWMKAGVMPKMKQVFQDFDGTKYADVKCVLCHGAGAKDGSFKMPNPDLPKLPGTPAAFKSYVPKHKKMVEFMHGQVTPAMAALVGEEPFDPKAKTGKFGCMECHTAQGK